MGLIEVDNTTSPEVMPSVSRLGFYHLLNSLGSDSVGVTYRAQKENEANYYAIKIFKEELSVNETFVNLFLAQAPKARALSHPFIVPFHDFDRIDGKLFFSMQFVDGQTVDSMLKLEKRIDPARALGYAISICKALKHAAHHRVYHQDIRPKNLIITRQGSVRLVGLGLANLFKGTGISYKNLKLNLGDPNYMAPEQDMDGEIDIRSDIYALGVTLFHMLAGRLPFEGPILSVRGSHHASPRPDIRKYNALLPESIAVLLQSMMAIEPEQRPGDPGALPEQFERIKQEFEAEINHRPRGENRSTIIRRRDRAASIHRILLHMDDLQEVHAEAKPVVATAAHKSSRSTRHYKKRSLPLGKIAQLALICSLLGTYIYYRYEAMHASPKENLRPEAQPVLPDTKNLPIEVVDRDRSSGLSHLLENPTIAETLSAGIFNEKAAHERFPQIYTYLESHSSEEKQFATDALVEIGKLVVDAIVEKLPQADQATLPWLLQACRRIDDKRVVPALLARLDQDGSQASYALIRALQHFDTPEIRVRFRQMMAQADQGIRMLGLQGLSAKPREEEFDIFQRTVEARQPRAAEVAASALGLLSKKPALKTQMEALLLKILKEDPEYLSQLADRWIGRLPAQNYHSLLKGLLDAEVPMLRQAAISALGSDRSMSHELLQQLEFEQDMEVLTRCLNAIAQNPVLEATPTLMKLLNHASPQVRERAHNALVQTYGVDLGRHSISWRSWLEEGARENDPTRSRAFSAHVNR